MGRESAGTSRGGESRRAGLGGADVEEELDWALLPVRAASTRRRELDVLLGVLGWNAEKLRDSDYAKLVTGVARLDETINGPDGLVEAILDFEGIDDLASWKTLVGVVKDRVVPLVRGGLGIWEDLDGGEGYGLALGQDLVDYLVCRYLHERTPLLYNLLLVLDVVQPPSDPPTGRIPQLKPEDLVEEGRPKAPEPPLRYARRVPQVDLERLFDLLRGEASLLDPYGPDRGTWRWPRDRVEAMAVRRKLFPRLGALAWDLGWEPWLVAPRLVPETVRADDPRLRPPVGQLSVVALREEPEGEDSGVTGQAGLHLQLYAPGDAPGSELPSFQLQAVGALGYRWDFGSWGLEIEVEVGTPAVVLGPERWDTTTKTGTGWDLALAEGASSAMLAATAASSVEEGEPSLRLGRAEGSRLELGAWSAGVFVTLDQDGWDLGLKVGLTGGLLVLRAPDDGFLGSILPPEGMGGAFDLKLH